MPPSILKNPFVFATLSCLICSLALSLCAQVLRPLQEKQVEIDTHRNILRAVGEVAESDAEVEEKFTSLLRFIAIDAEGNVVENADQKKIISGEVTDLYPLYLMEQDGEPKAYVLPMRGQGLWGPISGYLALDSDANTIRGATFFPHKETPGLGAEIANPPFQGQFPGKHIRDDQGKLVSIQVVKGKAAEIAPNNIDHAVDGVSGATITSRGVMEMFKKWLNLYEPYFEKKHKA